jgi:amino acid permease
MLAGLLFVFTSIAYLPGGIFKGHFDRNAAPEFIAICLTALILGIRIIFSKKKINLSISAVISGCALLIIAILSWSFSGNLITGLTGDTGRYTGLVSLFCLILISIFFSAFILVFDLNGNKPPSVKRKSLYSVFKILLIR